MTAISTAPAAPVENTRSDQSLIGHLQSSEFYRSYRKAFENATGLPLAIRAAGSFQPPLRESRHTNPFCAMMAKQNKSCSACLQLQQAIEIEAQDGAKTIDCFAGLSDSAVPVRLGGRVVGFLQTGQILRRQPTETHFRQIVNQLSGWSIKVDTARLRTAYFQTRVVAREQYDSVVRLLSIFAEHLSSISNQLMVKETTAEAPAVTRARAYLAEHQAEEISLSDVAHAVNMSAFYFCKVFKKATGLTFTEYLARVRVEKVKELLLNPHKRISEAAYEAGFQSLSQFNRVFRRVAGEAPSEYRERVHGAEPAASPNASRLTCVA
jgi:AraC-like DNA-binding protein/ligand-binding sensor protein